MKNIKSKNKKMIIKSSKNMLTISKGKKKD
jgi:hypothetical protein